MSKIEILNICESLRGDWIYRAEKEAETLTSKAPLNPKAIELLFSDEHYYQDFNGSLEVTKIAPFGSDNNIVLNGLKILKYLQELQISNTLKLFRAIRYPTPSRIYNSLYKYGPCLSNYEQERIFNLYSNEKYITQRSLIAKNSHFCFLPQERIVKGLPIFFIANDAIQIHNSLRSKKDLLLLTVLFIPKKFIENKEFKIFLNMPIEEDYQNDRRDIELNQYIIDDQMMSENLTLLSNKGIDLFEAYIKNLPYTLQGLCLKELKIKFYLLKISHIVVEPINSKINELIIGDEENSQLYMKGFWGENSITSRKPSNFLPEDCYELRKKETNLHQGQS